MKPLISSTSSVPPVRVANPLTLNWP
jgi:hypothetical protein